MCFSSFEVSALIFSPLVGLMLDRLGRKNSIMIGFVVVVLATTCQALTVFIEDDYVFLAMSILARFIQGMGDMWVQTACKTFIPNKILSNL